MRVRILIGCRAEKDGVLQHLDEGEIHELPKDVASILIYQKQAEVTTEKLTTRQTLKV